MNKDAILTRLQHLTGNLKSPADPNARDLNTLRTKLAQELIQNPELTVSGNRLPHEATPPAEPVTDSFDGFSHLDDLLERIIPNEHAEISPLIFRRETAFRNSLLGNSVPSWGTGLAATESFGPFIDHYGLPVWFDFFRPVRMVKLFLKGRSSPALLIPIRGTIAARRSYKIEPGSMWIASDLIARTSALQGFYTGLKVRGGTLELSANAEVSQGQISINPGATATINLDLNQTVVAAPSNDAGFDATEAVIQLPKTFSLRFNASSSTVGASDASCTVFGCDTTFAFQHLSPLWIAPLGQILVRYAVQATGDLPDTFQVSSSDSKLCTLANSAEITSGSGWLLPAAKIDPKQLGEAAGTGALCISLLKGINARWKGLKGVTRLTHPAIIAEPGMLTVIDFFAENMNGKQKWVLWQNLGSKHHSEIALGFGKSFPFVFVTNSKGSEGVIFFCRHKAAFDRPVDANGSPFRIESSIALAGVFQTGTSFRALLLDSDLLFDGNPNKLEAYKRYSIALRNALFHVSPPYSLFLSGDLQDDNNITKGVVALTYGIHAYLPTLPDPYVASYTSSLRRDAADFEQLRVGLAGFVKWPNPAEAHQNGEVTDDPAYVYFKFVPLNQSLVSASAASNAISFNETRERPASTTFQTGVRTFNQDLTSNLAIDNLPLPQTAAEQTLRSDAQRSTASKDQTFRDRISSSIRSGEISSVVGDLEANPLLNHLGDITGHVDQVLRAAVENTERATNSNFFTDVSSQGPAAAAAGSSDRSGSYLRDFFMLLDVSSRADQMGVSFGTAIQVDRNENGETNLRRVEPTFSVAASTGEDFPLQIFNLDVVTSARSLRAVTLPQISWEPILNIPLKIEGPAPLYDLITVTPGSLIYDNDGIPTRIFSESPYSVPITPLSVTKHFLKEFNDKQVPRRLHSFFTLPFALLAQANLERHSGGAPDESARVSFNRPRFEDLEGGLQIKSLAPKASSPAERPSFNGRIGQIDDNIKWFLFGLPITGSTLGYTVNEIFTGIFSTERPTVLPLERIEFSGYGATTFSNWFNTDANIADVSQVKFDVMVGRTAHEVVQVRSVMYMETGCVHLVRTITLMRSPNGYVFRSDSGWKAESDAFFDCHYKIRFGNETPINVNDTYEFHPGVVKGVSNIREIRDYPAGGIFKSSFSLNETGLPARFGKKLISDWTPLLGKLTSLDEQLPVELQAVVFDGDVHFDNITSGGSKDTHRGDFKVQSRKMLGYVQLRPSHILIPPRILADLLSFQNGSLGGPLDCILDVASSKQKMRLNRADLNPALDNSGKNVFVGAARGSLILPPDGSWSVVKQHTDTGDVKPVEEGQSVPLIKANGASAYRIADPADIVQAASKINFGVLQSTGTQKLLFDIPQFTNGVNKLLSSNTYFADAYKLLNSKGVFPNIANALTLTNAEKSIDILGEGLMHMADREIDLNSLLPATFQYPFIDEPDILKIYAEYKSTPVDGASAGGKLKLGIDSAAAGLADKWKAALSNIRIVVDLGPFKELVWVDGNFNASSGVKTKYDAPHLQFGPLLEPVVEILQVLATLSGEGFDEGMNVGMSNSPDNWEYKFNCSKEIPVIKFPSPEELTLNPNPPLKLQAGLKVGFYFNEVLSIPTDLKQLVPACGAYVDFTGGMEVQCFTLGAASIYAVGQVTLGVAADTKAGISLHMKFGFGVEIVVGLPVVANVAVLYMVEVSVGISAKTLDVGALMLFRGSAEICGGLVAICIQIEAGGSIHRENDRTDCIAQVSFSIDVCVLWVIDIDYHDSWQESRQIA